MGIECSAEFCEASSSYSYLDKVHKTYIPWDFSSLEKITLTVLSRGFFGGYDPLDFSVAKMRGEELIKKHDATPIECQNPNGEYIDVLYLPSNCETRSGNVVLFAETTSYQDRLEHGLPTKYKYFLDHGADVVLWNPTKLTSKQYAEDLLSVINELKRRNESQKIVIRAHCAGVEPSIAAAVEAIAKLKDNSISLILDRGYADTWEMALSFTILTKLPFVTRVIQEHFSCDGMQKLKEFPGRIIFLAPKNPTDDQIACWKGKNFTYAMYDWRKINNCTQDVFIKLSEGSDHFSSWNATDYAQITEVLKEIGIVTQSYKGTISQMSPPPRPKTWCERTYYQILVKAWL